MWADSSVIPTSLGGLSPYLATSGFQAGGRWQASNLVGNPVHRRLYFSLVMPSFPCIVGSSCSDWRNIEACSKMRLEG